jgi:hypothetical protein
VWCRLRAADARSREGGAVVLGGLGTPSERRFLVTAQQANLAAGHKPTVVLWGGVPQVASRCQIT